VAPIAHGFWSVITSWAEAGTMLAAPNTAKPAVVNILFIRVLFLFKYISAQTFCILKSGGVLRFRPNLVK
jgi:hypothetical protein